MQLISLTDQKRWKLCWREFFDYWRL